jgi:hypothetical protein
MYRQTIPGYNVSIEEGTENVPKDGRYYVLKDNQIVGKFTNLKRAREKYLQLLEEIRGQ